MKLKYGLLVGLLVASAPLFAKLATMEQGMPTTPDTDQMTSSPYCDIASTRQLVCVSNFDGVAPFLAPTAAKPQVATRISSANADYTKVLVLRFQRTEGSMNTEPQFIGYGIADPDGSNIEPLASGHYLMLDPNNPPRWHTTEPNVLRLVSRRTGARDSLTLYEYDIETHQLGAVGFMSREN